MARITSEETIGKWKKFDISVIVFVMLTGAGFGAFAGIMYIGGDNETWAGLIAGTGGSYYLCLGLMTGAFSGYYLAKWYLKLLMKMSLKGYNKKLTWLLSTLIAVLCGIICTTVTHGLMILTKLPDMQSFDRDGVFPIVIIACEIVGACAGLIVGSISSLIYVLSQNTTSFDPE
jgi:hypothetical protein